MADLGQRTVSLADLLWQLPPDVVDHNILRFLDKPSRRSLKLASCEVADLVRACCGLVTLDLTHLIGQAPQPGSQEEHQAQILRQYTSARQLELAVNSGAEVTAALVSLHAHLGRQSESKAQLDPWMHGCMDACICMDIGSARADNLVGRLMWCS